MFYQYGSPSRNTEGLSRFPLFAAAAHTGLSESRVRACLFEIQKSGLISWDGESETLLDYTSLPLLGLHGKDHRISGAINRLEELQDSPLFNEFYSYAEGIAPDLADRMRERFGLSGGNVKELRKLS
jgi:hypothetical protein